jgi:hypothetical protein
MIDLLWFQCFSSQLSNVWVEGEMGKRIREAKVMGAFSHDIEYDFLENLRVQVLRTRLLRLGYD